mgnify:CR=1 FL=1
MFSEGMTITSKAYPGVILKIDGPAIRGEWIDIWDGDRYYEVYQEQIIEGMWHCHMVGDDRDIILEEQEINIYNEEYCPCGQLGCEWD